ncbi:MAG: hypothetical protein IKC20_06190, partial [Clostridia bacterium]|nr:hypothetical protein [Clostridia bacterium]
MNEKQKEFLKKAAVIVLSLFFIFYVSYQVYLTSFEKVETETALEKTVNNSLFTTGFFVREEEYIVNSASGTVIPIAQDGKKVSSGDTVAVAFGSDSSVESYMRTELLKAELERYTKLNSITPSSGIDADALDSSIGSAISDLVDRIDANDIGNLSSNYAALRDSVTKKQLILGADINFQDIIDGINSELEMLEGRKLDHETINATGSGY